MSGLKNDIIDFFSAIIEKETGIIYNSANVHSLESRLREFANSLGFDGIDALWMEIKTRGITAKEKERVLDLATNNETSFFRDIEVFDFFKSNFVPNMTSDKKKLRIWCAATSTGQEPYTLAMLMSELKDIGVTRQYEILASDISERVLRQAKEGIYSQIETQRGLSAEQVRRYFDQIPSENSLLPRYKIKPELTHFIKFKRLNLLDSWQHSDPFDIIFCRNVLIYQDLVRKRQIISRLALALEAGGYLILGGAESLLGLSSDFDMQLFGRACVYKLKQRIKVPA